MILILTFFVFINVYAVWEVGDIVEDDYSWTDSDGEDHSIHELTASGKAVLLFWGSTG